MLSVKLAVSRTGSVKLPVRFAGHELPSNTVTVYDVPPVNEIAMLSDVPVATPNGQLKVYPAVPPVGVTVKLPVLFPLQSIDVLSVKARVICVGSLKT